MKTPARYLPGSLKQDVATRTVAVRTSINDPTGAHDWSCMTPGGLYRFVAYDQVQGWPDMHQPHMTR
jgi:hypothetical protein